MSLSIKTEEYRPPTHQNGHWSYTKCRLMDEENLVYEWTYNYHSYPNILVEFEWNEQKYIGISEKYTGLTFLNAETYKPVLVVDAGDLFGGGKWVTGNFCPTKLQIPTHQGKAFGVGLMFGCFWGGPYEGHILDMRDFPRSAIKVQGDADSISFFDKDGDGPEDIEFEVAKTRIVTLADLLPAQTTA
jgi:hypothetical protein